MLKYFKGPFDLDLKFKRCNEGITLKVYTDFDFAWDLDKGRSTLSCIFTWCDGCVSWKSQLQKLVALSPTKVEYIDACDTVKENLWLRGL